MKLPPLLVYSVLRLLAFLVPLAVLLLFPIFREQWWLATLFAAIIGLSISVLFLRRPLSNASAQIHERREARSRGREGVSEEEFEDAATEAATASEGQPGAEGARSSDDAGAPIRPSSGDTARG